MGAICAFWLDVSCASSHIDIFKFLKKQLMLMCEKNWYGEKSDNSTLNDYFKRIKALAKFAPGADPARYVRADDDGVVLSYDFTEISQNRVKDRSHNGFDANIISLTGDGEGLLLDSNGYIESRVKTVSDPYEAELEIFISSDNAVDSQIFGGEDGEMYYNYDDTGKIAFMRKGYTYVFDYVIPTDRWIKLKFCCLKNKTYLYIDGEIVSSAVYLKGEYELDAAPKRILCTFQLPLEKICRKLKGKIRSLTVKKRVSEESYEL